MHHIFDMNTWDTVYIFNAYHCTNMSTTLKYRSHNHYAIAKYVSETNIPTKLGVYAIYDKYFMANMGIYTYKYATYKVTGITCATRSTIHIFNIHQ